MSMNGKFLRPPEGSQSLFDDSDEDESGSDNEESNTKKRSNANLSDSDGSGSDDDGSDDGSESGEEEEEDEEEEDDEPSRKRKTSTPSKSKSPKDTKATKKSKKGPSFFDEEAEVEGSDEEEEPYGTHHDPHDIVKKHYSKEDIEREQMDEEAREMMRQQDRRRAQQSQFSRGYDSGDGMSVADITRDIEERHRMQRRTVDRSVIDGEIGMPSTGVPDGQLTAVSQQSLVPSVSDPSIWMYSCIPGKEQELVFQIMNKCVAFARQGKVLGITACIAAQTKGKVYIESYSEPSVMEAVQGVRGLMAYSKILVPINDMTTLMTVVPKKKPVKKNDWVRMNRGHYKGDLALVVAVKDSGLKCIIQCVPRLDLTLMDLPPEEARIRRRTVRPPQKFFNASEVKNCSRERFQTGDMCDYYEGSYYHDGYLLKEVTVGSMVKSCTDEHPPALEELQKFRRKQKGNDGIYDDGNEEENEGSRMAASLLDEISDLQGKTGLGKSTSANGGLIIGDTVEVVEGDLVGMRGKLLSLDGTTVKVQPSNAAELGDTGEIEFLASQVMKHIPVGSHVKVTDGRYAGETGVVVAVEKMDGETDCTAVVLTDLTNKEVSVRTSQLQESAEVASGQDKLAGYELHDLVVLSGGGSTNEVGVIIRVGREEFSVINNHGIVREVRPEELRGKRNSTSQRAVALDVQGNQIRTGDTVNIAEGPYKGRTATIKRMSRAQLFLYSQTRQENSGIFVVRSRSCVLSGSRASSRGSDQGGGNVTPYNARGPGGPGGREKKEDGIMGKTVRIQSGTWKGYLGCVCDTTPTHVRVELHSRLKKVLVLRERVAVAGDKHGATDNADRTSRNSNSSSSMAPTTPFLGGATPMHGGATPMHGGATPMHEGFTPSHSEGADDVWRPGGDIDRTPMREDSEEIGGNSATGSSGGWGDAAGNGTSAQSDPFAGSSSGAGDSSGGWGASSSEQTSTWAPATNESSPKQSSYDDPSSPAGASTSSQQDTYVPNSSSTNHNGSSNGVDTSNSTVDGSNEEAPVWFMERVCVEHKTRSENGVIKEIKSNNSALVEFGDKSSAVVRPSEVSLISPREHDMVLVTGGADVGVEGELVCIDGSDAILKDSNEEFKIVDLVYLAKIEGDA